MLRFTKKLFLSILIVFSALIIANASSGISQLQTDRGVTMQIVKSEDALISLPETIDLNITVHKLTVNYYRQAANEEKEFVQSEEQVEITAIEHNLSVINKLGTVIKLDKIEFSNSKLSADVDGVWLGIGERFENIVIDYIGKDADILDEINDDGQINQNAALHFSWDQGQSIIYKDVIMNVNIDEEVVDEIIQ